jgi:regulatory protein
MIRKPAPLEYEKLMEYAVRTLAARAHSASELRRKLSPRAANRDDIQRVIAALKEAGAVSDERFAESFAASRLANRGFGRQRVIRELRARQVGQKIADEAVASAYRDTDELELIDGYIGKKFRGKDLPAFLSDEKNLQSAYRKLRMAGFSAGNSIRALRKYSQRADELEDSDVPK